jgi:hypothetical protein
MAVEIVRVWIEQCQKCGGDVFVSATSGGLCHTCWTWLGEKEEG